MNRTISFLLALLLAAAPVSAQDFLEKKAVKLGQAVPDFELSDINGTPYKLSSFQGKPVLLHFWSAQCPFVKRYEERLQEITRDYGAKDVTVLAVDSNATETAEQIRSAARERNVNYPILLDPGSRVADQFGAVTTPHVFIIDREGKLAYEGSVDDQGYSEKNPVTKKYAREALDAVLSGKPVPNAQTESFGCTVKRAK